MGLGIADGKNPTVTAQSVVVTVRSLSGRWTGRLNCITITCAGSFVDLAATLTQVGSLVNGTCSVNSGPVSSISTSIATPATQPALYFGGGCGGSSADMSYDASIDRINVIWRVDWVGNLTR